MSIKKLLLNALSNYRGDDLERAQRAFTGLSQTKMQELYGESGETRQAILDGYQRHADACEKARAWVKANAP